MVELGGGKRDRSNKMNAQKPETNSSFYSDVFLRRCFKCVRIFVTLKEYTWLNLGWKLPLFCISDPICGDKAGINCHIQSLRKLMKLGENKHVNRSWTLNMVFVLGWSSVCLNIISSSWTADFSCCNMYIFLLLTDEVDLITTCSLLQSFKH